MLTTPDWRGDAFGFVDALIAWLETSCDVAYGDAPLTLLDHLVQTAGLARLDRAPDHEIAAALLHDIGHVLLGDRSIRDAYGTRPPRHEELGARWLARYFRSSVTEPIRLHAPARRYLCAVDRCYRAAMTEAAIREIADLGGPMIEVERRAFERHTGFAAAIALQRRDVLAGSPGVVAARPASAYRTALLNSLSVHAPVGRVA